MNVVYSQLEGREVDSTSEEWRHECECRWLLERKPTRNQKHLYLYGVIDRAQLMTWDSKTGRQMLRDEHRDLWMKGPKPLMHYRGLAGADRILADARKLYEMMGAAA